MDFEGSFQMLRPSASSRVQCHRQNDGQTDMRGHFTSHDSFLENKHSDPKQPLHVSCRMFNLSKCFPPQSQAIWANRSQILNTGFRNIILSTQSVHCAKFIFLIMRSWCYTFVFTLLCKVYADRTWAKFYQLTLKGCRAFSINICLCYWITIHIIVGQQTSKKRLIKEV